MCAVLLLVLSQGSSVLAASPKPRIDKPVTSRDLARSRSSNLFGSDSLNSSVEPSGVASDLSPVDVIHSLTPFPDGLQTANPAWKIAYDTIWIKKVTTSGIGRSSFDCTVWIDSLTGRFLLARLHTLNKGRTVKERLPTADETSDQLLRTSNAYLGYPETEPTVSMLDALKTYNRISGATEMHVSYTLFSQMGGEIIPVWVVYLRGAPRLPLSSGETGPAATTQRVIVNALTGDIIYPIGNRPIPILRE